MKEQLKWSQNTLCKRSRHNYGLYLSRGNYDEKNYREARYQIGRASFLIETHERPEIEVLNSYFEMVCEKDTAIFKKNQRRLNFLDRYLGYADHAYEQLGIALDKKFDIKIDYLTPYDEFEDYDEDHEDVISEYVSHGVYSFAKMEAKEPTNWGGILLWHFWGLHKWLLGLCLSW